MREAGGGVWRRVREGRLGGDGGWRPMQHVALCSQTGLEPRKLFNVVRGSRSVSRCGRGWGRRLSQPACHRLFSSPAHWGRPVGATECCATQVEFIEPACFALHASKAALCVILPNLSLDKRVTAPGACFSNPNNAACCRHVSGSVTSSMIKKK